MVKANWGISRSASGRDTAGVDILAGCIAVAMIALVFLLLTGAVAIAAFFMI